MVVSSQHRNGAALYEILVCGLSSRNDCELEWLWRWQVSRMQGVVRQLEQDIEEYKGPH